jgi:general secretion pathway protein K
MNRAYRRHQRGVILLSALIMVALATVVAAALFFDTGLTARRARANYDFEQAWLLVHGAEALAAQALADDEGQTDTPSDSWASPVDPVEVEEGLTLEARLVELNGRFNINTLVNADGTVNENAMKVFTRLLELAELDTRWADLIADWVDPDTQPAPNGGEDSLYLAQTPPHRAGNLTVTSVSELQQLPDFTLEMLQKLEPHIAALPPSSRTINVCMASGLVLDALFAVHESDQKHVEYSGLTEEEMAERRASGCYPQRSAFASGQQAMQQLTAERSSWFRLETWVSIGTAQFALYSLMQREGGGQVRAVARSMGTY